MPVACPEESYPICCVVVCDLETSRMKRPWPTLGRNATEKKKILKQIVETDTIIYQEGVRM